MTNHLEDAFKRNLNAAEQGDTDALFIVGDMYFKGYGVPQDKEAAFKWYILAAEQGVAEAHNKLGCMYGNGDGVRQDYVIAYTWFAVAIAFGNLSSVKELEKLYACHLTPIEVSQAAIRSLDWIKKIKMSVK